MRAAAGFDAYDAVGIDCAAASDDFGVLLGEDVVGDSRNRIMSPEFATEFDQKRGLARANGAGDAEADGVPAAGAATKTPVEAEKPVTVEAAQAAYLKLFG